MSLLNDLKAKLKTTRIMLPEEYVRQLGYHCKVCGSRKVVYFISKPLYNIFPARAYCYSCLCKQCRAARAIPFPIETNLLNQLKLDLGIPINEPPRKKIPF